MLVTISYPCRHNLTDIANDSRFTVSNIFHPVNREGLGFQIKPFVLIGDSGLRTDKELKETYLKQLQNPSLPKRVKMWYVNAPKGTLENYVDNLIKILNHEEGIENLGNLSTPFKMLSALFSVNTSSSS